MKIFKIDKQIEIVCDWKKTRNGFKHTATLLYNGQECESVKCCYLNRTWERYEYESVLKKLAEKSTTLSKEDKARVTKYIQVYEPENPFRAVAMVAKLGDMLTKDQKASNDWKTRMLKAGLEGKGLIMPEDWDTLSEDEKETRLNKVIAELGK